jgi:hypothetical protein
VALDASDDDADIAVLGEVRQLPALTSLELTVQAYGALDPVLDERGPKVS